MLGQLLGHYRILEEIGAGGMGVVYRARDERLHRDVAVKILPAGLLTDDSARQRFSREAFALSRLNHPNIETVFDFDSQQGIDFIVMELIPGASLDVKLSAGRLPEKETLHIGIQLAEGLAAAHEQGVIHRDIKPANLRVTPDGRLKILDFGLAKLVHPPTDVDVTMARTKEYAVTGTLPYMAPEQLLGEKVDARTDIFAAGLVLYEMATGRRAFLETQSSRLIDTILNRAPFPPRAVVPGLRPELEPIILKCQEKDPDNRYQSARELAVDLRRLERSSGTEQQVPRRPLAARFGRVRLRSRTTLLIAALSVIMVALGFWVLKRSGLIKSSSRQVAVAVLPFQAVANDSSTEFLRMAFADEVVTELSRFPSVAVRPFAVSMKYGKDRIDVQAAGRELRVSQIVTGQYLRDGDNLRVTLEIIEAEGGRLLWRDSITSSAADLIQLQKKVSDGIRRGVVVALGVTLTSVAESPRPANGEAFDLYLRSAAVPYQIGPNQEAVAMLERAVGLDPKYAPAWNALGLRYSVEAGVGLAKCPCEPTERSNYVERAKAAYERALALDPTLVDASAALVLFLVDEGDLKRAHQRARQMVQSRPDHAQAHFSLSYVLRYAGLLADSARECDAALSLDPGNLLLRSCAITFMQLGDQKRALEYVRLDGNSEWAARTSVDILLRQDPSGGMLDELVPKLAKAPAYELLRACLSRRPAAEINRLALDLEMQMSESSDAEPDYFLAAYQAFCGRDDAALRLLRRAIEHNYCSYPAIEKDPFFARLRQHQGFAAVDTAARECQQRFLSSRTERADLN